MIDKIFARKIAKTKENQFFKWIHNPHNQKFHTVWRPDKDEFLIDETWSIKTSKEIDETGDFAIRELKSFFEDTGNIHLKKNSNKSIILCKEGNAGNRIENDSYSFVSQEEQIKITGCSWRAVLYGVYFLEQILLERGIPALKKMSIKRQPLFDIRMFGDVYGTFTVSGLNINRPINQNTFSALSRFGANATFNFTNLADYIGDGIFSELANPERENNFEKLAKLANLAHSAGIDLYLNAYNPKLRPDHLFFKNHPEAKGATQQVWAGGGINCLCTSNPEVLHFISESYAEIFSKVPHLGGMLAIIGGEGFYHCYMSVDVKNLDCPRCRKRCAEDVVADLTNTVFHAIRKVKADAELLAWPYSAHRWSKDPFQESLIEKLDPEIRIVAEIDKDHMYQKNGYIKKIWDYSIDFLGPSDRYLSISKTSKKRGMKLVCKTETSVSIELFGVPYIPCLQRWGKRMEIIKSQQPESIIYAYDIAGFTRSKTEELAYRLSWEPCSTPYKEIKKIAERDFGRVSGYSVIKAWNLFSKAMSHYPVLTFSYYTGPSFIGAGQPLMLVEKNMPEKLFGRLFYLAEADESGGGEKAIAKRPLYYSDVEMSKEEINDMDKVVNLWEKGVNILRLEYPEVIKPYKEEFKKELNLAIYILTVLRATANTNHFFSLRKKYFNLLKNPAKNSRREILKILKKMESIIERDLKNAKDAMKIVASDPRFDLSVRLDIDFPPTIEIIKAKIKYQKTEVKKQFLLAKASLMDTEQKQMDSQT